MLAVSMELNDVLTHAVETGATDVHFKLGQPPVLRSDGALAPASVFPLLDDDLATILDTVTASAPRRREAFDETGELDIAYASSGLPRFRVNGLRRRDATSFLFDVSRARAQAAAAEIAAEATRPTLRLAGP